MIPCVDLLNIVREGFQFLRGVVTDLQLNNLMMIATTVILYSTPLCKFIYGVCRHWDHVFRYLSINYLS